MRCETGSWFRISDQNLVEKFKKLLNDLDINEEDKSEIKKLFDDFAKANIDEKFERALKIYSNNKFIEIIIKPFIDVKCPTESVEDFKKISQRLTNVFETPLRLAKTLKKIQQKFSGIQDIVRDNVIHQIQVFLVGCYFLYDSKNFWFEYIKSEIEYRRKILEKNYITVGGNLEEVKEKERKRKKRLEKNYGIGKKIYDTYFSFKFEHIFSIWAICSLYHDMGKIFEYLYNYSEKSNEILELINNNILGISNLKLRNIFDEIKKFKPLIYGKNRFFRLLEMQYDSEEYKILKEILEHDFKHLKHGFYSALLMLIMLFQENEEEKEEKFKMTPLPTSLLLPPPLIAMSLHVYKDAYIFGVLTQLLIIADNVQEWQRTTTFYDRRFIMFTDEVKISKEVEKHDKIDYLLYCVSIEHKLDRNSIRRQVEDKYENVLEDEKDAIEILFYKYTKPEKRYEKWGEDFKNLLKSLQNLNNVSKEKLFNLFLKKIIKKSEKAVGFAISIYFKGIKRRVLYICGRCHKSKYISLKANSKITFKCDKCDKSNDINRKSNLQG